MSTEHELVSPLLNSKCEMSIIEHSCLFDLSITVPSKDGIHEVTVNLNDLTPEQIRIIAIKMIYVASYSSNDSQEFLRESSALASNYYNHLDKVNVLSSSFQLNKIDE